MRQLARIVAEPHGDVVAARIEGEIDMSNAPAVGNRLRDLLTNRSEALVVDLSPTTYLDSSGIALLFSLADELQRRQQRLHLVLPEESQLGRAVQITGLDRAVATHRTLTDALEATR
jgi:anti-anti-sigma factor